MALDKLCVHPTLSGAVQLAGGDTETKVRYLECQSETFLTIRSAKSLPAFFLCSVVLKPGSLSEPPEKLWLHPRSRASEFWGDWDQTLSSHEFSSGFSAVQPGARTLL